ncbi:DUF421 domain-containing protein [Pseudalkalibacillus caeni]|uniref:DUF421 domain-containing protein n=1 Tax=Exobacillus caeni TaxID=2574798 RepID=A0A5R9F0W8_9BACL|nr:DUF421 domain-containing protein [Pseudalkalibacillus caeni]TLS35078.1 DUF421 domain-containing protein [Pseudalkalibacillus caeni]
MTILEITIRTIAGFVTLYILARILGKKLISQMTFFDFVAGITIGTLTGAIITTKGLMAVKGLYALALFTLLAIVLDVIALKAFRGRKILNDEPTIVIKDGKFLGQGMGRARLNLDQLLMQLRKKNIFYLDEVEIAFLETDGTVSVLKKPENMTVTHKDMKIDSPSRGLAQTFIIDGQVLENSLLAAGKDMEWVETTLKTNGIDDVREVTIAQIDVQGKVFIDQRKDQVDL